jgi:hypothetical protein
MAKFLVLDDMIDALWEAGVIDEDKANVRRVVIDLQVGEAGRIYIEKFADREKLQAALEAGVTIVEGKP